MDIKGINNDPYSALTQKKEGAEKVSGVGIDKKDSGALSSSTQGDLASVSFEGKLRAEGYRVAMQSNDIREDKVSAIKAEIEAGTYTIDSKSIAEKMLFTEDTIFKA